MALEDLKKDLMEADADMRSYLESSEEYVKLKVFRVLTGSLTNVAHVILVGSMLILALFMFSLGASLAINQILDSFYIGFVIIGLLYVLIAGLCYIFREKLDRPIIRKFSKHFFS